MMPSKKNVVFALLFVTVPVLHSGCSSSSATREYVSGGGAKAAIVAGLVGPREGFAENEGTPITGWEVVRAIPYVSLIPKVMVAFQGMNGKTNVEHIYVHRLLPLGRDPIFEVTLQAALDANVIDASTCRLSLRHAALTSDFPSFSILRSARDKNAISQDEYRNELANLAKAVISHKRRRNPNLDPLDRGMLKEACLLGLVDRHQVEVRIRESLDHWDCHDPVLLEEALELGVIDREVHDRLLKRLYLLYRQTIISEQHKRGLLDKTSYESELKNNASEIEALEQTIIPPIKSVPKDHQ